MTAGGDTFINDMLERCGFQNIFTDHVRYPVVELQQLAWLNCKHILLSSEPFPFREKHVAAIKTALIDSMSSSPGFSIPQIQLVDGEMFSWYGSRLLPAAEYFKRLREILFPG